MRSLAITRIDTVRRWAEDEGATLDRLRADLLDTAPMSEPALAGTALGQLLETAPDGLVLDEREIWTVPVSVGFGANRRIVDVDLAFDLDGGNVHVPRLVEVPIETTLYAGGVPVRLKGRLDGWDGGPDIVDYKATGKPDLEAFELSFQWRCYLSITGARRFTWDVFTMRPPLKGDTAWRIVERQRLTQWAYPGMDRDVEREVARTVSLIDRYVPEYWTRAERR